jgi:hypothetical protein
MSVEENKATIERYFHDGLDQDNQALVQELFAAGAKRHMPGREGNRRDGSLPPPRLTTTFRTEIHDLIGEGENVVARITHFATYGPGAEYVCQMGSFPCNEHSVQWDATVVFRFVNGKIDEEWINRDELGVLRQLGHVGK